MPRGRRNTGEGSSSNLNDSVIEGKIFNPDHFSDEVVNIVAYQGLLEKILLADNAVYPELVKEFYQNMEVRESQGASIIKSIVRGVKINLNPPKLAKWFKLQLTGISTYNRDGWIEVDNVNYRSYLQ